MFYFVLESHFFCGRSREVIFLRYAGKLQILT